jgi:hypothetical protein
MTELDVLLHARDYMEKLSCGINPITDEPYDENSDMSNERIVKCFQYVASLLGEIAENKGIGKGDMSTMKYVPPKQSEKAQNLPDESVQGKDVIDALLKNGCLSRGVK